MQPSHILNNTLTCNPMNVMCGLYIMKPRVILIIMTLAAIMLSCCTVLHPVRIIGDNNTPLTNALVVYWITGWPISGGKKLIWSSDSNGVVCLPSFHSTFEAGCNGYYPIYFFVQDRGDNKVVLSHTPPEDRPACDDYEYMRLGTTVQKYERSPLWREWGDYLVELESKGFYDHMKITSTNRYF